MEARRIKEEELKREKEEKDKLNMVCYVAFRFYWFIYVIVYLR